MCRIQWKFPSQKMCGNIAESCNWYDEAKWRHLNERNSGLRYKSPIKTNLNIINLFDTKPSIDIPKPTKMAGGEGQAKITR